MIEIIIKGPQGEGKTLIGDVVEAALRLAQKRVCRFSAEGERYPYHGEVQADVIIKEYQENTDTGAQVTEDGYLVDPVKEVEKWK